MQDSVIHGTVFQALGGILQAFPIKIRSFLNPVILFFVFTFLKQDLNDIFVITSR